MAIEVGEWGITGWYYRVLNTGVINVGDKVELVRRESNTVNVQTLMHCTHIKTDTTSHSALFRLLHMNDKLNNDIPLYLLNEDEEVMF